MGKDTLSDEIYKMALMSGFDDYGIVSVDDMNGYREKLRECMDNVNGF